MDQLHIANDGLTEVPDPLADWVDQSQLAEMLGVSEKTASIWARSGRLRAYEHGFRNCGRRKYGRTLLQREIARRWDEAVQRQETESS